MGRKGVQPPHSPAIGRGASRVNRGVFSSQDCWDRVCHMREMAFLKSEFRECETTSPRAMVGKLNGVLFNHGKRGIDQPAGQRQVAGVNVVVVAEHRGHAPQQDRGAGKRLGLADGDGIVEV